MLLLVVVVVASPLRAQDELLIDEALPADSTPTELPPDTATPLPDTPTRRPTRPPTATVTATASDTATAAATDTATAAPTDTPADTPTAPPSTPTRTGTPRPTQRPTAQPTLAPALPPTATAIVPLFTRLTAGGDPGLVPVALGALLALLSAWLGARLARAGERRERRRARQSLATAMLLELRRLDAVLRRVVALDNPAAFPSLDHPIIEGALRDLTLFDTETAARLAQFHGAVRGIQHEIADYRDNPLRWAGRLGELNQLIKTRAAAACRAVPDLLRVLERAGGKPPPQLAEPTGDPSDRGHIPPSPFGTSDDDWTM